jgi:hypothetical protein
VTIPAAAVPTALPNGPHEPSGTLTATRLSSSLVLISRGTGSGSAAPISQFDFTLNGAVIGCTSGLAGTFALSVKDALSTVVATATHAPNAVITRVYLLQSALAVAESGSTAGVSVKLSAAPSQPVTVTATSPNTAEVAVVAPGTVVFQTHEQFATKTIVFQGVDDAAVDADVMVGVAMTTSSADLDFDGLPWSDHSFLLLIL